MEKALADKIYYFIKKKKTPEEICKALELSEVELIGLIKLMNDSGYMCDYTNGEIVILKKPVQNNGIYQVPHNLEHLKLLLISDTHLAGKYDRLDILRYLYEKAEDKGVKHILHSGDFTDGRSNRPEHIYELKEPSYEGQVEYCVEKYPTFSGKTYAIQGNHDNWWYKSNGSEIVRSIAKQREDIVYLGSDIADMKIGKLKVRLFHGTGGNAYAKSYKIQKYLDAIPIEEKPHILQTGHVHQAFYYKQDKTHCLQTGCLEDLTPYARSCGFNGDKSCWWVDIDFDDRGNIHSITPQLEEFNYSRVRKK
jgi:predicted phosphodiesterase